MGNCVSSPETASNDNGKAAPAVSAPAAAAVVSPSPAAAASDAVVSVEALQPLQPASDPAAAATATFFPAVATAAASTTASTVAPPAVSATAVDSTKPAHAAVSADAVEVILPAEHKLDELALVAAKKVVAANPEGGAVDASALPDALIANFLDLENGPAKGLAYEVHYLGPPRPPCEEARLATTCALGRIDGSKDPEIDNILHVISGIFEAPVALCALFDKKRVFISGAEGGVIPRGDFPWRWTLCGWSLAFTSPMILVIPDTHEDARFRDNHKVIKEPNVRFYCGAPLIASNGHRLGTLCFIDTKPRVLDATSCMIMNNFSELVVRQLEKDIVLEAASKENNELVAIYGKLERTLDAFEHCVVLLDTHAEGWKLVFANSAFKKVTGVDREIVMEGAGLGALFELMDAAALPTAGIIESAAAGKSFELVGARIKAKLNPSAENFVLRFRPAGKDFLDEATMPIGVPAFLPTSGGMHSKERFYFMTIDPASSTKRKNNIGSATSTFSLLSSVVSNPDAMEGLELGHLLGKGSFGAVYYGTWFGTPVAVKIIEADLRTAVACNGVSMEAVLSTNLRHPLIVSTLKYTVKNIKASTKSDCSSVTTGSFTPSIGENGSATGVGAWGVITFDQDPGVTPGCAQMPVFDMDSNNTYGGNSSSTYASSKTSSSTPSSTRSSTRSQTWMIMEFCDKGSLQDAIDRGWLMASRSCLSGLVNMEAVTATALELASALSYLHSKGVVHGDLSGWNCMLSSAGSTASVGGRNFVAKIADFGLSRTLDVQSKIQTRNYGTMTHMPPETLVNGVISKATDAYSFGVLMWQMYTSSRPWCGLSHAQIIMQVGTQGAKLVWPKGVPPVYRTLATSCMDAKPEARPKFEDIVSLLDSMQKGETTVGEL